MNKDPLTSALAKRLAAAARMTPNNTRPDWVDEQWELVADTIDLMIDKAVLELKNSLTQGKSGDQK